MSRSKPVTERLPPLNALRAFEAAARFMSFSAAAAELHVTPGAVSHQIKLLEDHLGVTLFRRANGVWHLSEAGQTLLPSVIKGFSHLHLAVRRLRYLEDSGSLTVSVAPSFGAKWLVPRLETFIQSHPDIELRVATHTQLVNFLQEDFDCAIRFGFGRYPGLFSERLAEAEFFSVCSPALLNGKHLLRSPDELLNCVLLHDETIAATRSLPSWDDWFRRVGLNSIKMRKGPRFNSSILALEAAANGKGVALAMGILAAADINSGRLVRPFSQYIRMDYAYHFVCAENSKDRPKIETFRRWLHDEMAFAPSQMKLGDLASR